jgi:large subunit ribosomal protein L32
MAVPRHSHTRSKVGKSRMNKFIKRAVLNVCPKCKKPVLSHTVCKNCGFYKGKEVINVLASLTKKEKKVREKEMKQVEREHQHESNVLKTQDVPKE